MRRTARTIVGVLAASLAASVLGPLATADVAGATGPQRPVRSLHIGALDRDVTVESTPVIKVAGARGATYDLEVAHADQRADALGPWKTLADDVPASRSLHVAVRSGQVACVRVRYHDPEAPWSEDCVARPTPDQDFAVHGERRVVADRGAGDHRATVLRLGGRMSVPGLVEGSWVGACVAPDTRVLQPVPRWTGGDGEQRAFRTVDDCALRPVTRGGAGHFFSNGRLGARPIDGIVVLPPWFQGSLAQAQPLDEDPYPPGENQQAWSNRGVLADGDVTAWWWVDGASDVRLQVQVRRGPVLGAVPSWRDVSMPRGTDGVVLPLSQGSGLCLRARQVTDDGRRSAWSVSSVCAVRGWDDGSRMVRGGSVRAPDPASDDGVSTRLRAGASMLVGRVPAGSQVGYLFFPDRQDAPPVAIRLDGRPVSRLSGSEAPDAYPDEWHARVPRAARATLTPDWSAPSQRISSVYLRPAWAAGS